MLTFEEALVKLEKMIELVRMSYLGDWLWQ